MIRRNASVCKADFLRYSDTVRKLEGLSASRGIAIGPAFRLREAPKANVTRRAISPEDAPGELRRFDAALEASRQDLLLLRDERNRDQSGILDAHLMMLSDPEFIPLVRKSIETRLFNAEAILSDSVGEAAGALRSTGDAYLAERAVDIEDAFGRVLGHLAKSSDSTGSAGRAVSGIFVPPGSILIARNMKPSETLSLRDSGIAGIALEEGGSTSHVAILARSWGIPAVMGARGICGAVADGEEIVLDAIDGLVVLSPGPDVLSAYRSRASLSAADESARRDRPFVPSPDHVETADGVAVRLLANIALPEEAADAMDEGASGIGLFRSEFIFLASSSLPGEEDQFEAYRSAVERANGKPVVIRTLDSGADKAIGEQLDVFEKNPLLGWRAVRYCLDRRDFFRVQLRALLRASAFGDLRVLFPMISCVEELDATLEVLDEAKGELASEGVAYRDRLKVGIMIEIPAAAVCADLLAAKVDFFSIGTNDLVQYTMAVDRENPRVAHLFDYFNPAVLRLIDATLKAGARAHIGVSMCGEMAGEPAAVLLLLGMGLRDFSMAPSRIASVSELVGKVSVADAEELARAALALSAAREIRKLVQERLKNYG